jgi:hypothetical protein
MVQYVVFTSNIGWALSSSNIPENNDLSLVTHLDKNKTIRKQIYVTKLGRIVGCQCNISVMPDNILTKLGGLQYSLPSPYNEDEHFEFWMNLETT